LCIKQFFFVNFGDGNWRQAEALIVLLAGSVEMNALAQGALRQFTQWAWKQKQYQTVCFIRDVTYMLINR